MKKNHSQSLNNKDHLSTKTPIIFYDGSCGVCDAFAYFVVKRMQKNKPFIFSPIGGKTFQLFVKTNSKEPIVDSVMVYDRAKNKFYFKTEAVCYVLQAIGKRWRFVSFILRLVPLRMANFVYDFVAKIRHRIFKSKKRACLLLPQELKVFFRD